MNEECCERCLMYLDYKEKNEYQCNDATCPCHAPTQPESSWEERFQITLRNRMRMNNDALLRNEIPWVLDFIRTEIEQVRGKAFMDGFDDGQMSGLARGHRDAMEELEGRLPKEEIESEFENREQAIDYGKLDDLADWVDSHGFNRYRTAVLNIIKSIKGE